MKSSFSRLASSPAGTLKLLLTSGGLGPPQFSARAEAAGCLAAELRRVVGPARMLVPYADLGSRGISATCPSQGSTRGNLVGFL